MQLSLKKQELLKKSKDYVLSSSDTKVKLSHTNLKYGQYAYHRLSVTESASRLTMKGATRVGVN